MREADEVYLSTPSIRSWEAGLTRRAGPPTPSYEDPAAPVHRSPARYLWVMLLAPLYEVLPLTCARCGAEMRLIAFAAGLLSTGFYAPALASSGSRQSA